MSIPVPKWVGKIKDNRIAISWLSIVVFDIYFLLHIYGPIIDQARKTDLHQYCNTLPVKNFINTLIQPRYWLLMINILILCFVIVKLLTLPQINLLIKRKRLEWLYILAIGLFIILILSSLTLKCWS